MQLLVRLRKSDTLEQALSFRIEETKFQQFNIGQNPNSQTTNFRQRYSAPNFSKAEPLFAKTFQQSPNFSRPSFPQNNFPRPNFSPFPYNANPSFSGNYSRQNFSQNRAQFQHFYNSNNFAPRHISSQLTGTVTRYQHKSFAPEPMDSTSDNSRIHQRPIASQQLFTQQISSNTSNENSNYYDSQYSNYNSSATF